MSYKCRCGGTLKQSHSHVEFFGIDFGVKDCEVCIKCGSEYLDDSVMEEIEQKAKEKKLAGN